MNSETSFTDHYQDDGVSRTQLELEWQIQHSQYLESLKILAGGVGHDLNNLLMTIVGNTDLMLQHTADEVQIVKNLGRIREAAGKASELTHQILSFIGKGNTALETVNLKRIIIDIERMLRLTSEKRAILQIDLDDVPAINADMSQVIRLVMNMITNASEIICSDHGTIGISLKCRKITGEELEELFKDTDSPEGEYIVLRVFDIGCGLDRDQIVNIFGPFFHTELTGKGHGMATALELVSNQNGAIRVRFDNEGERSISAYFPCADSLCERLASPVPLSVDRASKKTVLLVDDDQSVLVTTRDMIEGLGHSAVTAKDGFEAVEIFRLSECEIDCVILDLTMPEMDGSQTFSLLRGLKPGIPVILSSGYSPVDAVKDFSSRGFSGFLQKPYDLIKLQNTLESVFSK
ncbi:MAG: response regulator [Candidatus Sabulitectum sp.]|nr:response regulator [Candidatus Sabulitectum sp.]